MAKYPEDNHPEPPVLAFNPNQFFQILCLNITVIDCIADIVKAILFRLYLEALENVCIGTIRKALLQGAQEPLLRTRIERISEFPKSG